MNVELGMNQPPRAIAAEGASQWRLATFEGIYKQKGISEKAKTYSEKK